MILIERFLPKIGSQIFLFKINELVLHYVQNEALLLNRKLFLKIKGNSYYNLPLNASQ
jgi:hypothetical protein